MRVCVEAFLDQTMIQWATTFLKISMLINGTWPTEVERGRESNTIGVNIDISKSIVKWWIMIHNLSYDGYRNFKY